MVRVESTKGGISLKHNVWASLTILVVLLVVAIVYAAQQIADQQGIGGPLVPIPDWPGCSVRLLVELDKRTYRSGEPVTVTATLLVSGDCIWQTTETSPLRDFVLLINWTDQRGNVVPLADEETYWENWVLGWGVVHRRVMRTVSAGYPYEQLFSTDQWSEYAHIQSNMYDLSQPGTYTLTLIRLSDSEPTRIPGNTVTLTRKP